MAMFGMNIREDENYSFFKTKLWNDLFSHSLIFY